VEAVSISSREIHARKQAEGRLHLLSKIGMLAESNDLDGVLARAADLAIPELADWSVFELVHDGQLQRATVAHPDRGRAAEAERLLVDAPTSRSVDGVDARIYHIGSDEDALRTRSPELHAVLKQLDAVTANRGPVHRDGAPIAIATFVFGPESGRRHSAADLAVAEEVARRAAQIVENARLHAELAQALAYRERVMAVLSHDLRNPVSAVLSLSSTLAQRTDVPERTREGLRHIHNSAERMEAMIATILAFTQLRFRGAPSLAARSVRPRSSRAANRGRAFAWRTLLATSRSARAATLRGRWDVSRMGQVISNLVGNALTHGARESPVTVSLDVRQRQRLPRGGPIRGPTIPSDAVGKLFEPFWQAPREGAAKSRGLGLGLFIAQQIVHAHDGTIAVQSEHEQTTFTVSAAALSGANSDESLARFDGCLEQPSL